MRVLVGYDGSDLADAALRDLRRAGLPADADAIVLCAVDALVPVAPARDTVDVHPQVAEALTRWDAQISAALAEARVHAERAAARLQADFPKWRITSEVVADSPGWAILKRASGVDDASWSADLILVGAAGHSAVGRVLFGSVAHKVLTKASCSTRIGRSGAASVSTPVRILIGADGSDDADAAVTEVSRRTWPKGSEFRVATVVDARFLAAMPALVPAVLWSPEAPARQVAERAANTLRAAGLSAAPVVKQGSAVRSLLHEAEEFRADCVFLGARGLGSLERFLLGSVSASVAMRAACSVEIVHPARVGAPEGEARSDKC